jgi:hypothetical protein
MVSYNKYCNLGTFQFIVNLLVSEKHLKNIDMTIQWKALEKYLLVVPLVFQFKIKNPEIGEFSGRSHA